MNITSLDNYKFNDEQIKSLDRNNYKSVEHYLRIPPKKYHDYRYNVSLQEKYADMDVAILGEFMNVSGEKNPRTNKFEVVAQVRDYVTSKLLFVKWIGQFDMLANLKAQNPGTSVLVAGKIKYFKNYTNNQETYTIFNPYLFETKHLIDNLRIFPDYGTMKGFEREDIDNLHKRCIKQTEDLVDILPPDVISKYALMDQERMYCQLHMPTDFSEIKKAEYRIVVEKMLYYAGKLELESRKKDKNSTYIVKSIPNTLDFVKNLPYELTDDQKAVCNSIYLHMAKGQRVNSLVQGDVGCGKTMVAFISMLYMADQNYQSVLMAPTAVLALQHYNELKEAVEKYGYKVAYLGSNQKVKERRELLKGIKDGTYTFIVGTHSVLSKTVEYKKLGLFITDEEHRFGVVQREAMHEKTQGGVHTITMSATPIPRTLAQSLYGNDMEVLTIKTKPAGRQKIKCCIFDKQLPISSFIEKEIMKGHQAYIICPLIDKKEGNMNSVMSVEETAKVYESYFADKTFMKNGNETPIKIGVCTGKMKKTETDKVLEQFSKNECQILISTTIVEVGVNIPNATVIVIQNAERFGLASMHQLRGRVGRSSLQSYCILKSEVASEIDPEQKSFKRLCALRDNDDGYEIALADLRNRGTGDLAGIEQSGYNEYVELMLENKHLFDKMKKEAAQMYDYELLDSYLENYERIYDITKDEAC